MRLDTEIKKQQCLSNKYVQHKNIIQNIQDSQCAIYTVQVMCKESVSRHVSRESVKTAKSYQYEKSSVFTCFPVMNICSLSSSALLSTAMSTLVNK